MPSRNCAGVSAPAGSTSTRTTAVLMPASLSAGRKAAMDTTASHRSHRRRLARLSSRACCAHGRARGLRRRTATRGGYQPLDDADALLGEVERQRTARPRRRGLPAGGQAAHGSRQRAHARADDRRRRQRRGGRTGFGQGPLAAAQPPAPGARRAAAGRARSSAPSAPTSTCPIRLAATASTTALGELEPDALGGCHDHVVTVEPGYVAGEETAAVRAINGGPAKPTDKPPRPFEEGVDGYPRW